FFFFQAEDGIRDFHVTGVQTCALPFASDQPADEVGEGGQHVGEDVAAVGRVHDEHLHEGLLYQEVFVVNPGNWCAHTAFESEIEISTAMRSVSKTPEFEWSPNEIPPV